MNVVDKAKEYYARGWWTLDALMALVNKGKLTGAQVAEITAVMPDEAAETPEQEAPESAEDAEEPAPETSTPPDYEAMTKHDLFEWAEAHGITVYESWTKAEIVAAIQAALSEGE